MGAFKQVWNETNARTATAPSPGLDQTWLEDFTKLTMRPNFVPENDWVSSFSEQQQAAQTASESLQDSSEAKDISSALIQQMANDPDPKFRNSKFLEFVQKLNSGELVIEGDNVVVEFLNSRSTCVV